MKTVTGFALMAFVLVACGADGKPVKPTYTTQTTIGYNSSTGAFNKTRIGVEFGS